MQQLDGKVPGGPLAEKWDRHRVEMELVNPANRRRFNIIVVGTGLAGASVSASLAEMGYNVKTFCIQDSPRRAHSIAAQGGVNAAKNYANDGDSIRRFFYDTIKGGDFRAREANVYRLAQVSNEVIDQCVAQGVPFAREYGGLLSNRSFGGVQVSRTFYARGQTGQQLLLGAYGALSRQIAGGQVQMFPRYEMQDLVVVNGRARGIVARNLITGDFEPYAADAVVLATGGYCNVFYLSTNAISSNASAIFQAYKKGAFLANPSFVQIHPTGIPHYSDHQTKLTLMSESLRNDARVWVPKHPGDKRPANDIPETERDYYLEEKYPSFGNLVPRDVASRNAKQQCDAGKGVGPTGRAVYMDFSEAIKRDGREVIARKYGNLFDMYKNIIDQDPYETPMMIYPSAHFTMGGLWVDYNLMSSLPGLFVLGEANFSDHGANRLGANSLMQALADGYFVAPYTIAGYLAQAGLSDLGPEHAAFKASLHSVGERIKKLLAINGKRTVDSLHKALGRIMEDHVGVTRNETGLKTAIEMIRELRQEFWENLKVPGNDRSYSLNLQKAGRLADFMELGELMAVDALDRRESCGGHLREESQSDEGEAIRDDENFCHVSAWQYKGEGTPPELHKEPLVFENVELTQRSYK
ncbi:MAG: fumarate reductase/succinate dehydrogenase flavoprotein subunit [Desulfobacteraceae bacterium]|nr:fumarate reductase/succinate dehydrogenase flavoprotein subunit [Desulfobacteraceae bacterium]